MASPPWPNRDRGTEQRGALLPQPPAGSCQLPGPSWSCRAHTRGTCPEPRSSLQTSVSSLQPFLWWEDYMRRSACRLILGGRGFTVVSWQEEPPSIACTSAPWCSLCGRSPSSCSGKAAPRVVGEPAWMGQLRALRVSPMVGPAASHRRAQAASPAPGWSYPLT